MSDRSPIYLDNNATTRPSNAVIAAVVESMETYYGNPSASSAGLFGGRDQVSRAAASMAKMLNAEDETCFAFTSGATESNNWVFDHVGRKHPGSRIVLSNVEHPSVAEPTEILASRDHPVVFAPVAANGMLDLDRLADALTEDVALVSILAANNETGAIQPFASIGAIVREKAPRALLHTDATQAIGKVSFDVQGAYQEADLISFSAHKFHGPKGVGGLYIRPGIQIAPLLAGGGQQRGLRSGTENTAGLAGLAVAAAESVEGLPEEVAHMRNSFECWLLKTFPGATIFGEAAPRLGNTACFAFPWHRAGEVVDYLAGLNIFVGTGSACSSGSVHPPKTLLAMGVDYDEASCAIRVSLSRQTTPTEMLKLQGALSDFL